MSESEHGGYTIFTATAAASERLRVLSQAETFGVFDRSGDIVNQPGGELGLFHEGTRFLSRYELRIAGLRPLLLSSTVKDSNDLMGVDLTNPAFPALSASPALPGAQHGSDGGPDSPAASDALAGGAPSVPRGVLHIFRSRFLWQGVCYEDLCVTNHGLGSVEFELELRAEADFADVFEVRGTRRPRRGTLLSPLFENGGLRLRYRGLDGVWRCSHLQFEPAPDAVTADTVRFRIRLEPQEVRNLRLTCACEIGDQRVDVLSFADALAAFSRWLTALPPGPTTVGTTRGQFSRWITRSAADLKMMTAETIHGLYPYAGIPWFNTIFGRDGIVTALELLWLDPRLARGVLATLAATQAREYRPEQDAEPGKILHETRRGEMAALGEVPFGMYYGSVDATQLFVFLAGEYYGRTGDAQFIERIWSNIELALAWIDGPGDPDGDGFVEYARQTPRGLSQQGWKDSHDSISHADGSLATGPVALCEVQAYVYGARRAAARLARVLRLPERARALEQQADMLRERFDAAFWSEDLGSYALALDGAKRPCLVRASNAGHCLLTGIAPEDHARRVALTLCESPCFSGWGVRTLAVGERRYNPMSYHNGSVWPHDNALIARGFARYGLTQQVLPLLSGLFDASMAVDLHRMPELICGFTRRPGEGPTLYPSACAPQSWSAGAVFMLLEASLGLRIDALRRQVVLFHPVLPATIDRLAIGMLTVGDASMDIVLERHGEHVSVQGPRRAGDVEILLVE
jgi:glycogen debranching enzyme